MNEKLEETLLCHQVHDKLQIPCGKTSCKYWIENPACQNCTIIASSNGSLTLQEIGDIFGVSRMRVCQIEKTILKKIKNTSSSLTEHV